MMLPYLTLLAVARVVLGATTSSHPRADGSTRGNDAVVKLPLQRKQVASPLYKRQSGVPVSSQELGWSYMVEVRIGSDYQPVPLIFDTGSSIIWVNPDCSKALESRSQKKEECLKQPWYNSFTSQTSQIQDRSFNLTYGLGSVIGSYFTDDFKIGSAVANNATFVVAVTSRDTEAAIFGAGGSTLEYPPTIIGTLAAQGYINSYAFSVNLKPLNQTGSVILGGIDTKKYKSLAKVPSSSDRAQLSGVGITFSYRTHIHFNPSDSLGENRTILPVIFDTGTPTNLLPNSLYFAIGAIYPDAETYTHPLGWPAFRVPCNAPPGTFDYYFGNTTIKVPLSESLYKDEVGICTFGFTLGPQDQGLLPYILGDSFLRGAYLVFDRDNDEVWMGETADCGSNVVPVGKGKDAVPVIPGCGAAEGRVPPKPTTRYAPPVPDFTIV